MVKAPSQHTVETQDLSCPLGKLLPCGQKLKSSEETTSLSLAAALGSEREKAVAGWRGRFPVVHMDALAKAGSGEEAGEETQLVEHSGSSPLFPTALS